MFNGWFRLNIVTALALAIYASAVTPSLAQQWPTRPVRLVLPFGPGSGADTAARLISGELQQKWGQPVIIDGKPGGDGLLSLQTVVSANDDHTLFFGPSSMFVVQRYMHPDTTFDPQTDLTPIAGVAKVQIAVAVPTSLGISTLAQFVALARAKPNRTSYAVAPGFSEFVFDGFVKENGLAIAKAPYRDITTSPIDLGENRIQLSMQSYAAMRTYAQTGKIKIIAINDRERSPLAPDIPSVVESGYPDLLASPVLGLLGPRGMPLDLRRRIAADVVAALDNKTVREKLALTLQPATPLDVDAYTAALKAQYAQVAHIASVLGIVQKK
ncbi:MAG TPA: tripartite tricarboxylate transporter substrate binding protein [Xanthobacteraceae bacterium]|nr:tripartite tricarboxylate transporter substrate binding protein [Xanthobacteraceae bacterium]